MQSQVRKHQNNKLNHMALNRSVCASFVPLLMFIVCLINMVSPEETHFCTYTRFMQGVTAWHSIDGDLTSYVDACQSHYRFSVHGLCACGVDTSVLGNYTVSFFISDPRMPSGPSVTRTIIVHPVCGPEQVLCNDLTCSISILCASGVLDIAASNSPPVLYFPTWQHQHVYVPQGAPYVFCHSGEDALQGDHACEQGVDSPSCCCHHSSPVFCDAWYSFPAYMLASLSLYIYH